VGEEVGGCPAGAEDEEGCWWWSGGGEGGRGGHCVVGRGDREVVRQGRVLREGSMVV